MRLRPLFVGLALAVLPVVSASSPSSADEAKPAPAPAPTWQRVTEDSGIVVFKQEVPGSPVIAFKGVGVVEQPISQVIAVITDTARTTEWMDSTAHARVVRRISPLEQIVYTHIKTPPIMTDRDFVTSARGEFDPNYKRFTVHIHSVQDAGAPPTGYVRGEIHHSSFVLTSIENGKKTLVVTEVHADPKGSVPTMIVNAFQKDWPVNTIKNLRKQAAKSDVHPSPELAAAIAKAGM